MDECVSSKILCHFNSFFHWVSALILLIHLQTIAAQTATHFISQITNLISYARTEMFAQMCAVIQLTKPRI